MGDMGEVANMIKSTIDSTGWSTVTDLHCELEIGYGVLSRTEVAERWVSCEVSSLPPFEPACASLSLLQLSLTPSTIEECSHAEFWSIMSMDPGQN